MKEAISRSGYLIEQRVSEVLGQEGYYVALNHTYPDPVTSKTREIDIHADSSLVGFEYPSFGLHWSIDCECENNEHPIVFFPFAPLMPENYWLNLKCFGIPMKIWKGEECVDLLAFLRLHRFHHYCAGNLATQYCSFSRTKDKDRSKWIAIHRDEQHNTFDSLVFSIEHDINQFYSELWRPPEGDEVEPIHLQFKYPLVVLGGELREAHIGRRGVVLTRAKHAQFLRRLYLAGKMVEYQIDVITEDYLPEYLSLIENEMDKVLRLIRRHKGTMTRSIDRIVQETKGTKVANSYRTLLTLE